MPRLSAAPMNQSLSEANFDIAALVALLRRKADHDGVWESRRFSKGDQIFAQGNTTTAVYMLESGLIKLSYQTPDGDEWIKSLIVDSGIFASNWPPAIGHESRFAALALEATLVGVLPVPWLQAEIATDPGLQMRVGAFNQWIFRRKQRREEALLCQTVEQRYQSMLDEDAPLLARLSQADIARYLRVTPIAFSRIKKRLRENVSH